MTPHEFLAHAQAEGFHFTLLPGNRVHVHPTPPEELLAELRGVRDAIATLLADPPAQVGHRPSRPGVLSSDPPAPVVDPDAAGTLVVLELAGSEPYLAPDRRLRLAHPQRVTPQEHANARQHEADIISLLEYRALIEQRRPASRLKRGRP